MVEDHIRRMRKGDLPEKIVEHTLTQRFTDPFKNGMENTFINFTYNYFAVTVSWDEVIQAIDSLAVTVGWDEVIAAINSIQISEFF